MFFAPRIRQKSDNGSRSKIFDLHAVSTPCQCQFVKMDNANVLKKEFRIWNQT